MMDLIIPVYKNIQGLCKTLMSIGMNKDLYVTVVDDHSEEDERYKEVLSTFSHFFPIKILILKENGGPGVARQYGLVHTKEPYVMFIDCGDTFYSTETIPLMFQAVKENPDINIFSYAHYETFKTSLDKTFIGPGHNRMHGKIYKREFLKKYNISFPINTSRAQEDIGFNFTCRCIAEMFFPNSIMHFETPAVVWEWDDSSIVRSNDCAYYYSKQTMGLAKAMIYAKKILEQNKVREDIIRRMIYSGMTAVYDFYLCTLNRRPEFTEESLKGCLLFYYQLFKPIKEHNKQELLNEWNTQLKAMTSEDNYPALDDFIPIDFLGFLNYLDSCGKKENNNE